MYQSCVADQYSRYASRFSAPPGATCSSTYARSLLGITSASMCTRVCSSANCCTECVCGTWATEASNRRSPPVGFTSHCQIGLRMCRVGSEPQQGEEPAPSWLSTADHCEDSTVNTNELSDPSVIAFILARAPPPVPRTVTR